METGHGRAYQGLRRTGRAQGFDRDRGGRSWPERGPADRAARARRAPSCSRRWPSWASPVCCTWSTRRAPPVTDCSVRCRAKGYGCEVIAPSLIPRRAGDRIKTDRRDCVRLAELSRAGELRAVWIPDAGDEAIRDLARAREDAVNARTQARHQLKAFLLRHEIRYGGKTAWSKAFYRWLGELNFGDPSSQVAFTEYHLAVQAGDQRLERLTKALTASVAGWRFEPVVQALQALRGIDVVSAHRAGGRDRRLRPFRSSAQADGLPGAGALGALQRRSSAQAARITKTGNAHARRLLTEAAWNYRFTPRIGRSRAGTPGEAGRADQGHCVEGAVAAERTLTRVLTAGACTTTRCASPLRANSPDSSGRSRRPAPPKPTETGADNVNIARSMRRCDSGHDRGDPRWPYHGTPKGMTRDARPRQPTRRIGEMWYPTHAYESDSSSLHRPSRITPSICKPETRLLLTSATIRGPVNRPWTRVRRAP